MAVYTQLAIHVDVGEVDTQLAAAERDKAQALLGQLAHARVVLARIGDDQAVGAAERSSRPTSPSCSAPLVAGWISRSMP